LDDLEGHCQVVLSVILATTGLLLEKCLGFSFLKVLLDGLVSNEYRAQNYDPGKHFLYISCPSHRLFSINYSKIKIQNQKVINFT